jgi:hypothetical protein
MAHAYKHVDASQVQRIFLLGPSHHVYSRKCALSSAQHYSTPLGEQPGSSVHQHACMFSCQAAAA